MIQFGGVGCQEENKDLWILAFHFVERRHLGGTQWHAVAVFTEYPSVAQIMDLYNFNNHTSLDRAIAESIIKNKYCAIFASKRGEEFKRDNQGSVLYNVSEYMLVHPKANGDLLLWDYMQSGYCDFPEKLGDKAIYIGDYQPMTT